MDSENKYPAVKLDRSLKVRLLKACAEGELRPVDFPELFAITPMNLNLLTDEELKEVIKTGMMPGRMGLERG